MHNVMNTDGKRFNIVYLREAVEFLESLDNKAREKVAYNITKAMLVVDKELFKKMTGTDIGNSEPCTAEFHTGCWLSGTLMERRLWSLPTASRRRRRELPGKRLTRLKE